MYKAAYIAPTLLPYGVNYGDFVLRVPSALYDAIGAKLGVGDWTYLCLRQRSNAEIVKVIGRVGADGLLILRGIDGTCEQSFTAGAVVEYTDTLAGVLDTYTPPVLVLNAAGAIAVSGYAIHYPLSILADEVIGLDSAHVVLGRKSNAYGCCK